MDARALVAASEQLGRTARDVLAGNSGTLRIGFGVATKILVPAAIARFRTERPQVTIELNDLSTHHQLLALSEGKLDLGFAACPPPRVALSAGGAGALCRRAAGQLRRRARTGGSGGQAAGYLAPGQGPSFYDHLMNYLAQSGLRFRDIQYVNDFAAGVATAAADIAWTLVPSSTTIEHPDVLTLPLRDTEASWIIGLIRPPHSKGPLIDAFWQIVADLSEPGPAS